MCDDRYDRDPQALSLAASRIGTAITFARIAEDPGSARLCLTLALPDHQPLHVEIGASGSLHDEAYLIFQSTPSPREPRS